MGKVQKALQDKIKNCQRESEASKDDGAKILSREEKADLKKAIESMTMDQKLGILPIVKDSIKNKHLN